MTRTDHLDARKTRTKIARDYEAKRKAEGYTPLPRGMLSPAGAVALAKLAADWGLRPTEAIEKAILQAKESHLSASRAD